MHTYFHGWRRKAVVVSLVMAYNRGLLKQSDKSGYMNDIWRNCCICAVWAAVLANACGCGQQGGRNGSQFRVISHFPKTIVVSNWEGLENNGPARGIVVVDGASGTSYGTKTKLPEKTVVTWHVRVNADVTWTADKPKKVFHQEITLADIAAADQGGVVEFILDENGAWKVAVGVGSERVP
jgi:hypothetical protein